MLKKKIYIRENWHFPVLIALVVLLWLIGWIAIDQMRAEEDRGAFGDKFGFVN